MARSSLRFTEVHSNDYVVHSVSHNLPKEIKEKIENGEMFGLHKGTVHLAGDMWVACNEDGDNIGYYISIEDAKADLWLKDGKLKSKSLLMN